MNMPQSPQPFDLIIANGLWFDGTGAAPALRHLGIRAGRIAAISESPLPDHGGAQTVDAAGQWVLPGFIDIHTHYDAEILVAPGLTESVRHGVTSVVLGSCSLSTVHANALDCADLFSRVEAIPHEHILGALTRLKTWDSAAGYIRHLESQPLGPNVAAFLGHSDLRTHVMGLGRAVDDHSQPDQHELERMAQLLDDALNAGFLGLSSMTTPWDKLDGERYRSKSLPSTFASWREYRRLNRVLRRRRRVLQSAPNTTRPLNAILFFIESAGFHLRPRLKTSLLVAADAKSAPSGTVPALLGLTKLWNKVWKSDLHWQHLPVPFEVYADGIDFVVFEEFGAGRAALHIKGHLERNRLLQEQDYRRQFRQDVEARFDMRLWSRNFHDTEIVACPETSLVGLSIGAVADQRGIHPADAFLDLVVAHGPKLRWRMTIANHRPAVLDRIASHPSLHLGFADSGAHLRNMAFYNMPVRFLHRIHAAAEAGQTGMAQPIMPLEQAVHRLTGELAAWYGLDAGTLRPGDRADIALINPAGLDASVDVYREAGIPEFSGMQRLVNRSDSAVTATIINGRVVYQQGSFVEGYGKTFRSGRFLRAGEGQLRQVGVVQ